MARLEKEVEPLKDAIPDFYVLEDPYGRFRGSYSAYRSNHLPVRRANRKVGRNEPCPCGSGRKFKNCCMEKEVKDG